jgi:hypothetical protein
MRLVGMLTALVLLAGSVGAGELVFTNGSRLEGELSGEMLLWSTGTEIVEVAPETVGLIRSGEIQLKDGRNLRGTLVGGRLRAWTPLGEMAVRLDELRHFRASGPVGAAPAPAPAARAVAAPATAPAASTAGLPALSLYQGSRPPAAAPVPSSPTSSEKVAPPAPPAATGTVVGALAPKADATDRPVPVPRLVVTSEQILRRDALANATPVGKVAQGEQVMYVDEIDRRLHFFNRLVFDGGHWIRVQATDGTVGWLPADSVREAR